MDLIQEVGKRLGVEVKIEPLEFDSLIASLKQGKIDAIISCMSPDEERLKEADFTKAYYITKHGIFKLKVIRRCRTFRCFKYEFDTK